MELFYLADGENPSMIEKLKAQHIKNVRGLIVTSENFDEFADYVIDTVIETVKDNRLMLERDDNLIKFSTLLVWEKLTYGKYEVMSKSRVRPYAACRQIIAYILHQFAPKRKGNFVSLEKIGDYIGAHHATVIHSLKEVESMKIYGTWKAIIDMCETKVERRWVKLKDIA